MTAVRPLAARNAEIATATVEIRTVTVSRKQMTLAVFRQLAEEELVSRDGKLAGNPWGRVNYHPGECAVPCLRSGCYQAHGGHLHVIWQSGDELRRSTVWKRDWCTNLNWHERIYRGPLADAVAQAAFCMAGHLEMPDWITVTPYQHSDLADMAFSCEGVTCTVSEVPEAPCPAPGQPAYRNPGSVPRWARRPGPPRDPYRLHSHTPYTHAGGQPCLTGADYQAAGEALQAEAARISAAADAELARREAHAAAWRTLLDLPQLFIAV